MLRKMNRSMIIKNELFKAKNRAFSKWKAYCQTAKKLESARNEAQVQGQFNDCLNDFISGRDPGNLKSDFDFEVGKNL